MGLEALPEIKKENGFTTIEAKVKLNFGLGTLRGSSKFCKECTAYSRDVFVCRDYILDEEKVGGYPEAFNCKSIMSVVMICAEQGAPIKIKVEGEDAEARRMALRLYSAVTGYDTYSMNFDRFEGR